MTILALVECNGPDGVSCTAGGELNFTTLLAAKRTVRAFAASQGWHEDAGFDICPLCMDAVRERATAFVARVRAAQKEIDDARAA